MVGIRILLISVETPQVSAAFALLGREHRLDQVYDDFKGLLSLKNQARVSWQMLSTHASNGFGMMSEAIHGGSRR